MLRAAVAAVVAAALVSTACSGSKESEPVVTVQTAVAKRTAIARMITSEAVLFPLNKAAVTPKISAPVHAFYVNRGSKVRSGQLLAVLENRDLAAAEMESKGSYEQAQAGYESTTAAGVPEGMQKAELELEQTQAAFEAQQKVFQSRQDLYHQGALPRKQMDEAGVALTQARAQFEIASKHLAALKAGGRQRQLRAASGELTAAKGRYVGAASQLSYSEIRSPIDGVVTERPLYPGEMAPAGTPLVTVMDLSQVIAKAHIPQEEAALLKAGDAATLEVPGSEAEVPGKVTLVSPALDIDSTTVEIWIQAPNQARALKPGTTVRVSIPAQQDPQAIVVPASAVLTAPDGGVSVMVMGSDQRAHQRTVKLGVRNGDLVQITTGLKAGEQVITAGAYGLPDNTRVRVETGPAPPE
ncbi:MAG TPA: efflux RND transporter periplasmic adaptor subunit [Terriglobales bacterium]|nr:efflux RND transporter periplasmic adaptor subunit [Terriglobales bacterium]